MSDIRRLYLSQTNKVIAGVCGGIGEYLGIDPVFIRIITVLLALFNGVGLIGYLIAWVAMPKRPIEAETETAPVQKFDNSSWNRYLPGAILILVGVYFLLDMHFWWWHMERYWPLLLIIAGALLIVHFFHKNNSHKEGVNESSQI
ncbi:MAG: PspC domain-containing protein [candidate division Zixibacteria bacterium]|nr:PspC domain-containing protein [candidate division Zixibacteria bacterium]